MSKEKTGLAGEFWFFSQLHRLGYEAFITLGNTKAIDITVQLKGSLLTFDVKSKINFSGSFMYLKNVEPKDNHFIVFVDLRTKRETNTGKCILNNDPVCYIIKHKNLEKIASIWSPKDYGFVAKLLPYFKGEKDMKVSAAMLTGFMGKHKVNDINLDHYKSVIWTIDEFENEYYNLK